MLLLLTNDDGINAKGLRVLEEYLNDLGETVIVSPKYEQSASSHSLTLRRAIPVEKLSKRRYIVSGTPTDCVLLGVQGLLGKRPDLLVSGINHGPNMGEDVTYSGTVAAAIEGTILRVPSIAVSSLQRSLESADLIGPAARAIVEAVLGRGLPDKSLLNVNIPDPKVGPIRGVKITKLGSRAYGNLIRKEKDPGGDIRYEIAGDEPVWKDDNGTDIAAVRMGFVSVTPLHLDLTHYKAIVEMERWNFQL